MLRIFGEDPGSWLNVIALVALTFLIYFLLSSFGVSQLLTLVIVLNGVVVLFAIQLFADNRGEPSFWLILAAALLLNAAAVAYFMHELYPTLLPLRGRDKAFFCVMDVLAAEVLIYFLLEIKDRFNGKASEPA